MEEVGRRRSAKRDSNLGRIGPGVAGFDAHPHSPAVVLLMAPFKLLFHG